MSSNFLKQYIQGMEELLIHPWDVTNSIDGENHVGSEIDDDEDSINSDRCDNLSENGGNSDDSSCDSSCDEEYQVVQEENKTIVIPNICDIWGQPTSEQSSPVNEKLVCSICLSDDNTMPFYKLPCRHYFHQECLTKWLENNSYLSNCPMCRKKLSALTVV